MRPRGGPPGPRHRWGGAALLLHLLAASVRLYGALLVLYPKAFRRRYSEEMRRDFSELMREGLQEGGATELVRVWAQALSDLVLTALKERGTMSARRYAYYLSMDPRIAARAAARAMVAVVLVAVVVSMASLYQIPMYEASAQARVDHETKGISIRPVAEETIRRLGLRTTPAELLNNLTVERVEGTNLVRLTYEDTDAMRAKQVANTVGKVSSELVRPATMSIEPVSPNPLRNGLLTLALGTILCGGLALALPGGAARVAGNLGGRAVRQGLDEAGLLHMGPASEAEGIKEKELLQALDQRGKPTAVEAALETSLSVEEAERMLQTLAAKGHLEVTVEHGRLLYALWERDAPL